MTKKRAEKWDDPNPAEIRYIFTEIANGRGLHGSFLVSFAEAVCRADPSNFELLQDAALFIIDKYGLDDKYLPPEGIPE